MLGNTLPYRFNRCLVASNMRITTTMTIITKMLFVSGYNSEPNLGSSCLITLYPSPGTALRVK